MYTVCGRVLIEVGKESHCAYGVCRHVTSRSKDQLGLLVAAAAAIADRHATARHPGRGVTVGDFRLVAVVEP